MSRSLVPLNFKSQNVFSYKPNLTILTTRFLRLYSLRRILASLADNSFSFLHPHRPLLLSGGVELCLVLDRPRND
jgi:hypothetical protein